MTCIRTRLLHKLNPSIASQVTLIIVSMHLLSRQTCRIVTKPLQKTHTPLSRERVSVWEGAAPVREQEPG